MKSVGQTVGPMAFQKAIQSASQKVDLKASSWVVPKAEPKVNQTVENWAQQKVAKMAG